MGGTEQVPSDLTCSANGGISIFERIGIVLLLLTAFSLRVYGLDRAGLWTDEATIMAWMTRAPLLAFSHDLSGSYFDWLIRQPFVKWHPTPWWARLPSVIAGVASLLVLIPLMRFFCPRALLPVLAIVALAPTHIRYSQEARYYIVVYLAVVLCWWAFARLNQNSSKWKYFMAAVSFALAALSTPTGASAAWIIAFYYCLILWRSGGVKSFSRGALAVLAGNLMAIPAYNYIFRLQQGFAEGKKLVFAGAEDTAIQALSLDLFRNAAIQSIYGTFAVLDVTQLTVGGVAVLLVLALGLIKSRTLGPLRSLLLLSGALLPALAIFYVSVQRNIPHIRYLMPSVPFVHVLLGLGLLGISDAVTWIGTKVTERKWLYQIGPSLATLGAIALGAVGIPDFHKDLKYSFNHTAQIFENIAKAHPKTYIVFPTLTAKGEGSRAYSIFQFYLNESDELKKRLRFIDPDPTTATTALALREIDSSPDAVFLGARFHYAVGEREPAWEALVIDRMGFRFRQHDARNYYIAEGSSLGGLSPESHKSRHLYWLRLIESELADDSAAKPAVVDDKLRLLVQGKSAVDNAEIAEAEDYLLQYSPSPNQRADILMRRDQLDQAESILQDTIAANPGYWFTYLQYSNLLEKRFLSSKNIEDLYRSLEIIDEARKNSRGVQEWVTGRELALIQILKEAKIYESIRYNESRSKKPDQKLRQDFQEIATRLRGWLKPYGTETP